MPFEYDPRKSEANKHKHGIDFEEAQKLWDDLSFLEIPVRVTDEARMLVIGKIQGKHWVVSNHYARYKYSPDLCQTGAQRRGGVV